MKSALPAAVGLILAFATPSEPQKPSDLWSKSSSPTITGSIFEGCKEFSDPEAAVSEGPITKIAVYHGGFINGIRVWYGTGGVGGLNGFTDPYQGLVWTEWPVPEGERIVRIEGEIAGRYVSRLRFYTDGGQPSPTFGATRGKPFVVTDPGKGALRTISGWANSRRHPSLHRAVTSMTFQFGAPYFIKSIEFDRATLEEARLKAAPERCAGQDFTNETSVEQSSTYTNTLTVTKTTALTFERSSSLTLGAEVAAEVSAKLPAGLGVKASAKASWERNETVKSGQTYTNSSEETVSWSVPVRVPPRTRIVASSTWRKYRIRIPFTYTLAWYQGTRDNIKKEVKLPGLYEDVRVDDLKHEFKEVRLK